MKNSNEIIGNETREVQACSAVPQPTAQPRAPFLLKITLTTLRFPPKLHIFLPTQIKPPL